MPRYVRIAHANGEEYAVLPATFRKLYEPRGFKASTYEDGQPYEAAAKPKARPKRKRARADRAAADSVGIPAPVASTATPAGVDDRAPIAHAVEPRREPFDG